MEIPLTEAWLEQLYYVLIKIYKETDDPIRSGFPIVSDFNKGMLNVCVNRPGTRIFGKIMYPHTLQRAAVMMHSIINFHPFVDGNKRMALLSVYYYLLWNGYTFNIPHDADEFTIRIAKEYLGLNTILDWLKNNTTRTLGNVLRHWLCESLFSHEDKFVSKTFVSSGFWDTFVPREGLLFFVSKVQEKHRKNKS